ncbi:MAG TPA: alkaline phosphatase PhoX [Actinomycetota bacterium]|nr:alkaline phosphatase PhoX [Actinomycetota bacterium]
MGSRARPRGMLVRSITLALATGLVAAPTAGADDGFLTSEPEMLALSGSAPAGSSLKALISSGDVIDGFEFQGIPDGIGVMPGPGGSAVAFVNHEESRVPFQGQADFQDASVSRLTLNTTPGDHEGAVLDASVAIPASAGFIRFCSSTMVGPAEGFTRYTYLTGEESNDNLDVPTGAPYGPDPSIAPQREAGLAVILDGETGEYAAVPGMGRHNHENVTAVPGGWDQIALISGDDTFSAPSSQLYLYLADSESDLWADHGSLWAFRVTRTDEGKVDAADPFNGANDYGDIEDGDDWKGRFIRVPTKIAKGLTAQEPQAALEDWSNRNNVFQFVRVEDIDYDRNDPRVIYFTDTSTTRVVPNLDTGRLMRASSGAGLYDRGRVFRMEFDEDNPRRVTSFSIFLNGDAGEPSVPGGPILSPDNLGTSENSMMVQEDATNAKVWMYDFSSETWAVVAQVTDSQSESSGIVDASEWFGPGAWLLDVQAHNPALFVEQQQIGSTLFKQEAGQLLLMKIPGS